MRQTNTTFTPTSTGQESRRRYEQPALGTLTHAAISLMENSKEEVIPFDPKDGTDDDLAKERDYTWGNLW